MVQRITKQPRKKSLLSFLTDYPLIYVLLILLMVAGLLVWIAHTRMEDFRLYQRQVAIGSVTGAGNELSILLSELRRSVSLFAQGHKNELNELAMDPEDDAKFARVEQRLKASFPEALAFTLANSSGDDLLNPFSDMVREVCRTDISHYIAHEFRQSVYIHPNPNGYHFDIMVPWQFSPQEQAGVFFVSFRPSMLSRWLANSQVSGHQLFLVMKNKDRLLIEVTAQGARDTLKRGWFLTPREVSQLDYAAAVPGTRWQLVDIPMPNLHLYQQMRTWLQAVALFLTFLGTSLLMLYLIKREEKKREFAEASLRTNHATLSAVFEGIGDPVYLKDTGGYYRMVNSAFTRLANKTTTAIINKTDEDLFPAARATELSRADSEAIRRGVISTSEEVDHLKGETRNYLVTRTPVKNADGEIDGLVGIRHDITELKQAESRVRQHERELAHVDRLSIVGEIASSVAHELNQPLGAVVNYAQACLRMVRTDKFSYDRLVNALELTENQAQRAGKIIHRIRDFVRKDTRRTTTINLNHLVSDTIKFIKPKAQENNTLINFDSIAELPRVSADRIQIEQVLLNIMVNAMEAMQHAHTSVRKLTITCIQLDESKVQVSIKDSGPGLESTLVKQIFEPFFTTRQHGMGMGLAISRSIIEAHSGRLWVDSNTAEGTIFHFTLPIADE